MAQLAVMAVAVAVAVAAAAQGAAAQGSSNSTTISTTTPAPSSTTTPAPTSAAPTTTTTAPPTQPTQCPSNQFRVVSTNTCHNLTNCTELQYVATQPTATTDRLCKGLSPDCDFAAGQYQEFPPVPGVADRVCQNITVCTSKERTVNAATPNSDTVCGPPANPALDTTQVAVLTVSMIILGLLAVVAVVGYFSNKTRKAGEFEDDTRLLDLNGTSGHDDDDDLINFGATSTHATSPSSHIYE